MDSFEILKLIDKCPKLKYKCVGVYSANTYPPLPQNTFLIVNASRAGHIGSHWLLLCRKSRQELIFADPLGMPVDLYVDIYVRAGEFYTTIREYMITPIQPISSVQCGLYCIYLAHAIFSDQYPSLPMIHEQELVQFMRHMK